MVETWRDSWFEEGMRVLYIYPHEQVDALLPLSIKPKPTSTTRVFVGRVEVLSPWTRETIQTAMTTGDVPTLTKFGRFLDPFLDQLRQTNLSAAVSPKAFAFLEQARAEMARIASSSSIMRAIKKNLLLLRSRRVFQCLQVRQVMLFFVARGFAKVEFLAGCRKQRSSRAGHRQPDRKPSLHTATRPDPSECSVPRRGRRSS